jgi:hypothetical protein
MLGAEAHAAGIRRQLAEDQAQQRGLAGAVGADQADLVAAQDAAGEVAHDGLSRSPKRLATCSSSATSLPEASPRTS